MRRMILKWLRLRSRGVGFLTVSAALVFGFCAPAVLADGGPEIGVDFGTYDTASYDFIAEAGIEIRSRPRLWGLRFAGGVSGTEQSAFWVWTGLQRDFALTPRWSVIPGFGIAGYEAGSGKDLGGSIQFRSSIEVLFAGERRKIGLLYYHLSNGGLYEDNPGSNSLVIIFRFSGVA